MRWLSCVVLLIAVNIGSTSKILMLTLGSSKSHKIPFLALAQELITRKHTVTFLSPFKPDKIISGMEEINPPDIVKFVEENCNWDYIGNRRRGELPIPLNDLFFYSERLCASFYDDPSLRKFLSSGRKFDVLILDSVFIECSMGVVHAFKAPFIYLNSMAFMTYGLTAAGNPSPYSITPFIDRPFTDDMNFIERTKNFVWSGLIDISYMISMRRNRRIFPKHFPDMPDASEMVKNVSFMLQNGHYTISYPRPYLPNTIEMGCIHCKPAKPINKKLEDFINLGGDKGFILLSMGTSVRTDHVNEEFRLIVIKTLARLPYQILWKWDSEGVKDLPSNVMVQKWLPQQDLLGHKKIRAFVTHSGLLSLAETVYHGVPVVTMPAFGDHDSHAAKTVADGIGLRVLFEDMTSDILYDAIMRVATESSFRDNVKQRQTFLLDDINTPMEKSVFWVEYVIRHKGAPVFHTASRHYNFLQYHSVDVIAFLLIIVLTLFWSVKWFIKTVFGSRNRRSNKFKYN